MYEHNAIQHASLLMPTEDLSVRILKDRAMMTASPLIIEGNDIIHNQYICFRLGNTGKFGIDYHHIREVIFNVPLTALPNVADAVQGMIHYRGELLLAINLGQLLQLNVTIDPGQYYVLIIESDNSRLAFVVSEVLNLYSYRDQEIISAQHFNQISQGAYIRGIHQSDVSIINMAPIIQEIKQLRSVL